MERAGGLPLGRPVIRGLTSLDARSAGRRPSRSTRRGCDPRRPRARDASLDPAAAGARGAVRRRRPGLRAAPRPQTLAIDVTRSTETSSCSSDTACPPRPPRPRPRSVCARAAGTSSSTSTASDARRSRRSPSRSSTRSAIRSGSASATRRASRTSRSSGSATNAPRHPQRPHGSVRPRQPERMTGEQD